MRRVGAVGLAEPIAAWTAKGEVVAGYLNPGDYFDEIHVLSATGADEVTDPDVLQRLCGSATVHFHHFPTGVDLVARTLGWRTGRFQDWMARAADIMTRARVHLYRSYSAHLNSVFLLSAHHCSVPTVLSLHAAADRDSLTSGTSLRNHAGELLVRSLRSEAIRTSDCVVGVYSAIEPYARRLGARRYVTVPNVVGTSIAPKMAWTRQDELRVCSVGRLHKTKDPTPLLRSVLGNSRMSLTLVGDGPLNNKILALASQSPNITVRRSVPNDEWCGELSSFDAFACINRQHGIPKAVMEAALAGLPIVINRNPNDRYSEFDESYCTYVDGSPEGFSEALQELRDDLEIRRRKGEQAARWAKEKWSPSVVAGAWTTLYEDVTR